jgi:hypothetical protein
VPLDTTTLSLPASKCGQFSSFSHPGADGTIQDKSGTLSAGDNFPYDFKGALTRAEGLRAGPQQA